MSEPRDAFTEPGTKPLTPDELRAAILAEAENKACTEPAAGAWLSVAEAAARLGVSERAVQRRCASGKLRAKSVTIATGRAWLIAADSLSEAPTGPTPNDSADADRPDANESNDTTTTPENEQQTTQAPTQTTVEAPTAATLPTPNDTVAATPNDSGDGITARYVEHLEIEVQHLRAQIEQHARAEAELRATIREMAKAAARALPSPAVETSSPSGDNLQQPATGAQASQDAPQQPEKAPTNETSPEQTSAVESPPAATAGTSGALATSKPRGFWDWLKSRFD